MKSLIRLLAFFLVLSFLAVSAAENGIFHPAADAATEERTELSPKTEEAAEVMARIVLDPAEIMMKTGSKEKILAELVDLPEGVQAGEYVWSTSDAAVADCDKKGTVSAKKAGRATITCAVTLSDGTEIFADCLVIVFIPVRSLSINRNKITIYLDESWTPQITIEPKNATYPGLSYTSSDETVAMVDEDGTIMGKGIGKAEITARTMDGSEKKLVIRVEVEQREGTTDQILTFLGIPWGSSRAEAEARMVEAGICSEKKRSFRKDGDMWFSPKTNGEKTYDLFWNYHWSTWENERKEAGVTRKLQLSGSEIKTEIGGYKPNSIHLTFYHPIAGGEIDSEQTRLSIVNILYTEKEAKERIDNVYAELKTQLTNAYGKPMEYKKERFCVWYGNDNTCLMCGLRKPYIEQDVMVIYAYTDIDEQEQAITELLGN